MRPVSLASTPFLGSLPLVALLSLGTIGCVYVPPDSTQVASNQPPEPMYEETPPPRGGYVWVRGNWAWRQGQWQWQRGRWEAERANYDWEDGIWQRGADGRYHWVDGRWTPRRGGVGYEPGYDPDYDRREPDRRPPTVEVPTRPRGEDPVYVPSRPADDDWGDRGVVIERMDPRSGPDGTVVRLQGRGFTADDRVYYGRIECTILSWSNRHLEVAVPRNVTSDNPFVVRGRRGETISPVFQLQRY